MILGTTNRKPAGRCSVTGCRHRDGGDWIGWVIGWVSAGTAFGFPVLAYFGSASAGVAGYLLGWATFGGVVLGTMVGAFFFFLREGYLQVEVEHTLPFAGSVAIDLDAENPLAHGGRCQIQRCKNCRAEREVNVNGRHREFGPWSLSWYERQERERQAWEANEAATRAQRRDSMRARRGHDAATPPL